MKRQIPKLILAALLACFICIPGGIAIADVGGFSGDSDYSSGSSSDWSSSWDDDDDDWSSSWDDDDDDDDWASSSSSSNDDNYSSTSSSSSSSEDIEVSTGLSTLIGAAILFVIVAFIVMRKISGVKVGKNGVAIAGNRSNHRSQPVRIQDSFDASKVLGINSLIEADPNFSVADIQEKLSNWYVQMQNAWTAKDFEPMRPMFTDALFAQLARQLDQMKKQGQTNYVDRIAVLGVNVKGWYEEDDQQCLVAELSTRIVDYTVNDTTGAVVSGSSTQEKFMTYRWILTRSKGVTTAGANGLTVVNCPNCAAALNINQTSRCPYCDSIVTLDEHDWAISAIQGLSQRTV